MSAAATADAPRPGEWRVIVAFCLLGPPIALAMTIAAALLWPGAPENPPPGAIGFAAAYPVLLIPAYLLGLPAAFAAGAGVVTLTRRGRGENWTTPLIVGGLVGALWCLLFFVAIIGDVASLMRAPQFTISMFVVNVLTTFACWSLTRRWRRAPS